MSRPDGAEALRIPAPKPERPRSPGGAVETIAEDPLNKSSQPMVGETLPLSPTFIGADETIEVDQLAFPRINPGEAPDATAEFSSAGGPIEARAPVVEPSADPLATLPIPGAPPAAHDPFETRPLSSFPDAMSLRDTARPGGAANSGRPYGDQIPNDTLDTDGRTSTSLIGDGEVEIVFNDMPRVPGYQLLGELGRGGMGVVYKARQTKLNRLVALKMVLAGAHASSDQLARFLIEAQAVAHLKHPNIVQIFEVNDHHGLPYFSLEFVDGGSLQGTIGGKPQPVRFAAKIVHTLTAAIADAHAEGIIHRDLKPANVLMSKKGEPKITDFGLAKRLEGDSQQTRDGAIMGTPSYMAPEQAWGKTQEIGPSADQHALGAILYEMLTGRPPYQGATALETLELVRHQEPVPPSRLQPKVPKDLETICLKALEKEPAKRYDDCYKMAEDLQRYLADQPILARPVSRLERTARWCKRNKKGAAAIGAVAASLLLAMGVLAGSSMILGKKNAALAVAVHVAEESQKKAEESEAETRETLESVDDQNFQMLQANRTMGMLSSLRLRNIPGAQEARRELLQTAKTGLDRSLKAMEAVKGRARTHHKIAFAVRSMAGIHQFSGQLYLDINAVDKANAEFKVMDEMAEKLFADFPAELESIKAMANSKTTLGDYAFRVSADTKKAERYYLQALELTRRWVAREPNNDIAKHRLANAIGSIAGLYLQNGDPSRALTFYDEEEEIRGKVGEKQASDSEFRRETAGLYEKLGDLQVGLGNRDKARNYYDQSLAIRKAVVKEYPNHPQAGRDVLLSLQKYGYDCLTGRNDPARAKEYYREAMETFEQRFNADKGNRVAKRDLALALYYRATAELMLNDRESSDADYRRALELFKEIAAIGGQADAVDRQAEIQLMLTQARCGFYKEAAKIADDIMNHPPKNPYIFAQAAYGYALASAAAERAAPPDKDEARRLSELCLKALNEALSHGWKNAEDIRTDPDLAPFRTNPAYPAVLKRFEEAAATAKKKP